MRSADQLPSIDWLREHLSYDESTGVITRLKSTSNSTKVGPITMHSKDGYILVCIASSRMPGHRVAWALHYGAWPTQVIDHINGVRDDNRISNLRDVSQAVNCRNVQGARRDNKSGGLLGAHFHRLTGKYRSQIKVDGVRHELGLHETPEMANAAYMRAKDALDSNASTNGDRK